jgi:hypothetical protein
MGTETKARLVIEAWSLVGQGDRFGIGRRFLIQHGAL